MTFSTELLPKLNSMTKYPAIPTYHAINPANGVLTDEVLPTFFDLVYATEKVDGTNGRIVVTPDGDWLVGSREEWFTARGDRVPNTGLRIAEALAPVAQRLADEDDGAPLTAYYLEVYGHGVGSAAKQYAKSPEQLDCRLFDVAVFEHSESILDMPRERIASWRDRGEQPFVAEAQLRRIAFRRHLSLVPRLFELDCSELPRDIEGMHKLLIDKLPATKVALSDEAGGRPEGVVLRDSRRLMVAKARFADYERTAKHAAREAAKLFARHREVAA
jgi:hypothetical protein